MLEAFIPVLTAIGNTLLAYRDVISEPSRKTIQNLVECLAELDEAYHLFEFQMNKVRNELEQGQIDKLKGEVSQYENAIDVYFARVIAKGMQIAREIALLGNSELTKTAQEILKMSKDSKELWIKFNKAVLHNEARHIRHFFEHVSNNIREYVHHINYVVQISVVNAIGNSPIFDAAEFDNLHESRAHESQEDSMHDETHRQNQQSIQQFLLKRSHWNQNGLTGDHNQLTGKK